MKVYNKLALQKHAAEKTDFKHKLQSMWEAIYELPEPLRSSAMIVDETAFPLEPYLTDTPPQPGIEKQEPFVEAEKPDDLARFFRKAIDFQNETVEKANL